MVTKTISIDGIDVTFKASASIPRLYRILFQRDIFTDLKKLTDDFNRNNSENSEYSIESLETFENVAYVMAKHADPNIGSIEDWLDRFNTFSIYEVLPEIVQLWGFNLEQESKSKKFVAQQSGR